MIFSDAGFWAAIAAALAALAAFLQVRATRQRTAASLLKQRFDVYRDLVDILGQLKRGTFEKTDVATAREAYHLSAVLFSSDIELTLKRIFQMISSIENAMARRAESATRDTSRPDLDSEIERTKEEVEPLLEAVTILLLKEIRSA